MIAYDLDGVICSDVNVPWQNSDFDYKILFDIRNKLCPIFQPTGQFYIITGRTESDRDHTEKWCEKYNVHPIKIFYNTKNNHDFYNISVHKADILNDLLNVNVFVESDIHQVRVIQQLTNKKVYHFSDFISKGLNETLSRLSNI